MAAPLQHSNDPTGVMGRRVLAYLIDITLATLLGLPFLIASFNDNIERTTYASDALASNACRVINEQTFASSDPDGAGSDFEFDTSGFNSESDDPFCVNIGNTTYTVSGRGLTRAQQPLALISLGIAALNLVVLQALTGASAGKWLTGLRVVDPQGRHAGFGACTIRWLVLFVDAACFLIGLLTASNSKGHRRLGDMAANTFVIRSRDMGTPIIIPGLVIHSQVQAGLTPAPTGAAPPPDGWPSAPSAPPAPVSADGPHWDDARATYIQYDRELAAWMEWDPATGRWIPITTD